MNAFEVLSELVRLKDLRCSISAGTATDDERKNYEINKPIAWDKAREVVSKGIKDET